jgi:tRNA threonylcarbamoyl adenosine modification protein (Sua5/YciO/YrdC/YwlC family)
MTAVSRRYDCSDPEERAAGIADAVSSVRRGELVVLPTDTVYGVGADAFLPSAVQALLDAKGRGREMPAPVLVGTVRAASALVEDLGTYGQDLLDEFWPGALTVVCRANPNLSWDLGETKGTVAVRMPLHDLAIELLKETGPMAVSSANLTGGPPARTAAEAEEQLGDAVAVYLDGGEAGEALPSSIVDLTGTVPRLLRAGAIPEKTLRDVVGVLLVETDDEAEAKDEDKEKDAGEVKDAGAAEGNAAVRADETKVNETRATPAAAEDAARSESNEAAGGAATTERKDAGEDTANSEAKSKAKREAKDAPAE